MFRHLKTGGETNSEVVAKIGDTEYTSLQAAIEAAQAEDTIRLTGEVTLTQEAVVSAQNVTLDLAGYTIRGEIDDMIQIAEDGSLTVTGDGTIATTNYTALNNSGTLTIESGAISAGTVGANAVYNNAGATIYIKGGSIRATGTGDTYAVFNCGGTLTVDGGEIYASSSYHAVGVNTYRQGTTTINGGTISIEGASSTGVYSGIASTVTINGGTIRATGGEAAGIQTASTGTITVTGGNIVATSEDDQDTAGALNFGSGAITIKGGSISANADGAMSLFAYAGPIVVEAGEINGNIAAQNGTVSITGGVLDADAYTSVADSAKVSLAGDLTGVQNGDGKYVIGKEVTVSEEIINTEADSTAATVTVAEKSIPVYYATEENLTSETVQLPSVVSNALTAYGEADAITLGMSVKELAADAAEVPTAATLTGATYYEVHPVAIASKDDTPIGDVRVSNNDLKTASFTVKIPYSGDANYLKVRHYGSKTEDFIRKVQGSGEDRYVELTVQDFSVFGITAVETSKYNVATTDNETAKVYHGGDTVTMDVVITNTEDDGSLAGLLTAGDVISYDPSYLTYTAKTDVEGVSFMTYDASTPGQIVLKAKGTDSSSIASANGKIVTLGFTVKEDVVTTKVDSPVEVLEGFASTSENTTGDVVPATVGSDSVLIKAQYTLTLDENSFTASAVTIDYEDTYTGKVKDEIFGEIGSKWEDLTVLIKGASIDESCTVSTENTFTTCPITEDVTVSIAKNPKTHTVVINGVEGTYTGAASAVYNTDYALTITDTTGAYGYAVSYKIGDGEEVKLAAAADNLYTIPGGNITGTVTITISRTELFTTVVKADYVTGYYLVICYGNANSYSYNGQTMFRVDAYKNEDTGYTNAFAYLVDGTDLTLVGDDDMDADATKAHDAIHVSDTTPVAITLGTTDINGTGLVDDNDWGNAYANYLVDLDVAEFMANYLRSNYDYTTECSKYVVDTTNDVNGVFEAINN